MPVQETSTMDPHRAPAWTACARHARPLRAPHGARALVPAARPPSPRGRGAAWQARRLLHAALAAGAVATAVAQAQAPGTRILRPLDLEVVHWSTPTLDVVVSSPQAQSVMLRVHDAAGVTLHASQVRLAAGERLIRVPRAGALAPGHAAPGHLTISVGANATAVRVGFGLLLVAAGQSNMANSGGNSCPGGLARRTAPDAPGAVPGVVALADDANPRPPASDPPDPATLAQRLRDGRLAFRALGPQAPLADGENESVFFTLGHQLREATGLPVGFVVLGRGGASIRDWSESLTSRFLYASIVSPSAILWHQGETDSLLGTPAQEYANALSRLIGMAMAPPWSAGAPWFVAQASKLWQPDSGGWVRPDLLRAQAGVVASQGKAFPLHAGPATDALPHKLHFDHCDELRAYARAWYEALHASGAFTGRATLPAPTDTARVNQRVRRAIAPPACAGPGCAPVWHGTTFLARVGPDGRHPWTGEDLATQFARTRVDPASGGLLASDDGSLGFVDDGFEFYLADRFVRGTWDLPLYQCKARAAPNVFASPVPGCESPASYAELRATALLGFAASSPQPGTVPLYRCHRQWNGHTAHTVTLDPGAECMASRGYALPPEFIGHVRRAPAEAGP